MVISLEAEGFARMRTALKKTVNPIRFDRGLKQLSV
jgi:hypothetical protein